MQPSIIIADDHPLILKGLSDYLVEKNYNITASATDGKAALNFIETLQPDIAILDIQMPFYTGLEIAEICNERGHKTKIIFITFEKDESLYYKAKELNVFGYVLKEFALSEIEHCITSVVKNKAYFSPELIQFLSPNEAIKKMSLLSITEKKIVILIARERTTLEIADEMEVSKRTIDKHRSNICRKLEFSSHKPTALVDWVSEHKDYILSLPF